MNKPFDLAEERSKAAAVTLIDIFHVLKVPEPHVALVTPEDLDDDYYRLPQLDVFRPRYTTEQKSQQIKAYLGYAAIGFASARGEDFRSKLLTLAEQAAHPDYDRPVWVDQAGDPMTINQILPDHQVLDAAHSAQRGGRSSSRLNSFIEQSIQDLGDRAPQLPGLL